MTVVTMMYPAGDGDHFDFDHYMQRHMPDVRRLWDPCGMIGDQVLRGVPGPDGTTPVYALMTTMTFTSMESFNDAMTRHGDELYGDVMNFTAIKPLRMSGELAMG